VDTGVHTAADSGFNYFTVERNRSIPCGIRSARSARFWRSVEFAPATVDGSAARALLVEFPA